MFLQKSNSHVPTLVSGSSTACLRHRRPSYRGDLAKIRSCVKKGTPAPHALWPSPNMRRTRQLESGEAGGPLSLTVSGQARALGHRGPRLVWGFVHQCWRVTKHHPLFSKANYFLSCSFRSSPSSLFCFLGPPSVPFLSYFWGWKLTAEEGDTASPRSLPHCKVVKPRARFARRTIGVSGYKASRNRKPTTT